MTLFTAQSLTMSLVGVARPPIAVIRVAMMRKVEPQIDLNREMSQLSILMTTNKATVYSLSQMQD